MKQHTWLFAATAAILLTGCIPSVNPFYTEADVVLNPALLGEWQEKKEGDGTPDRWKFEEFEKGGATAYKLTIAEEDGKKGEFKAVLFKLGREQYLDIIPTDCDFAENQSELVAASTFPGHLLIHVPQIEPELKLALCDFDWLQKHLEANPTDLKHHTEDERILLTAETRDLQRFVVVAGSDLFDDVTTLTRQTGKSSASPTAGQDPTK